ncbi:TPR-like protein [Hymenopellis radicata]|nr:TPR-like protein [Hymenopellis radicata]
MTTKIPAPSPAQLEKDKGDGAFNAGNFPQAIGHYSAAIVHDRKDYRLPLNRAAAYLKLGKHEDAVRDCTTTLALSPNNAKALFRRSQARVAIGDLKEAEADLKTLVKLQPSDDSMKKELEKVSGMLKKASEPKSKQPITVSSAPQVVRRRIPITIVEPDGTSSTTVPPTAQAPKAVPKSILKKSSPLIEDISDPSPKPSLVNSTREAEMSEPASEKPPPPPAKPVRVGGGIFRANGSQTVFPVRDVKPSTDPTPSTSTPQPKPKAPLVTKMPANLFDLNKIWDLCPTADDRFHLLTTIPPSQFPAFFQTSLGPGLLTSIMQTFVDVVTSRGDDATKGKVKEYLNALSTVPRFATLLLFLSPAERDTARKLLSVLNSDGLSPIWAKTL